ncbi:MAG: hypothetical protein WDA00_04080 [Eubacteriales bacterium]
MTDQQRISARQKLAPLPLLGLLLFFLYAEQVAQAVGAGLSLCARVIVPSLFPFMVLSEGLQGYEIPFGRIVSGKWFEKIFRVNRQGVLPLLLGLLCGFPLGAKAVCDGYKRGAYTKAEAEHLAGFVNNTGPAFVVAGIGAGMRRSVSDGLLLYGIQVVCALLVGALFRPGRPCARRERVGAPAPALPFVRCVWEGALHTLYVCAFVVFFGVLCSLAALACRNEWVTAMLAGFLEIGNAAARLSLLAEAHPHLSFVLTAGAVSFAGLSVHLQSALFFAEAGLPLRRYLFMKCVCACFAMGLAWGLWRFCA